MEIKINIEYEAINKIYLNSDSNKILILSNEKKEISAKEIFDFLNYQSGKKYILEELSQDMATLDENNKNYIDQIYKMMKSIINGINSISQEN